MWRSGDNARMAAVLAVWEGHLADPRLPRRLLGELRSVGFTPDTPLVLPLLNVGFDPVRAFSAGLIDIIGDLSRSEACCPAAEVDARKADLRSLGDGYFFSLNLYGFRADPRLSANALQRRRLRHDLPTIALAAPADTPVERSRLARRLQVLSRIPATARLWYQSGRLAGRERILRRTFPPGAGRWAGCD